MASYKINGYDLLLAFGIVPDQDKSTASSFESPPDIYPAFSRDWEDENGIEYDLDGPTYFKPRVFTIKGTLVTESIEEYTATKLAIETVIYQNYVTLEHVELELTFNAKLKPGGINWNRLTNLKANHIVVSVQFQFDEVRQNVPFKDSGNEAITYLVDNQMRYYNTQNNNYLIT